MSACMQGGRPPQSADKVPHTARPGETEQRSHRVIKKGGTLAHIMNSGTEEVPVHTTSVASVTLHPAARF